VFVSSTHERGQGDGKTLDEVLGNYQVENVGFQFLSLRQLLSTRRSPADLSSSRPALGLVVSVPRQPGLGLEPEPHILLRVIAGFRLPRHGEALNRWSREAPPRLLSLPLARRPHERGYAANGNSIPRAGIIVAIGELGALRVTAARLSYPRLPHRRRSAPRAGFVPAPAPCCSGQPDRWRRAPVRPPCLPSRPERSRTA
jgi:hypothetical protein